MNNLISQIKELKQKRAQLKTKKAQDKVSAQIETLETRVFTELDNEIKKYGEFEIKGTSMYDTNSDCMFKTEYGTVHSNVCNDVSSKSWYDTTCCITLSKGQEVVISGHFEIDFNRYCIVIVTGEFRGGTLDVTRYEELDKRTDLAFFKHSDGNISGLFERGVK